MARRSSCSSLSGAWRYLNPAYYLKRPKRLVLLFFVFIATTFAFWDRQSLVSEYEIWRTEYWLEHYTQQDRPLLFEVYPEGTHIVIPWFERPIMYDVRARSNLVESTSGSRDLQMVPTPGIGLICGCTRGCSTLSTRRLFASFID